MTIKQQRIEKDSLGEVAVPSEAYWGAQTQRALHYFHIGEELVPVAIIQALALIKQVAAEVNLSLGLLAPEKARLIQKAAAEILEGQLADQFPLKIWQTGSGTQTHMNVNEVIANRANELAGSPRGAKMPVHPNDDVNLGQSTNDVFPTAMHMAAVRALSAQLIPAVRYLREKLYVKQEEFRDVIKVGRTHLQDAVPLTLGQEFSGYVSQLDGALGNLEQVIPGLYQLAIGGTAVGTGLNAHPQFGSLVAKRLAELTNYPFVVAENRFAALAAHDALIMASGAMKTLAVALMKISNDVRWLASGPRCGLGELRLPANEPGSSIMPGKVNPTQCEVVAMICLQVFGCDTTLTVAGGLGNFELNVYKPLMIYNFLRAANLLAEGCRTFADFAVRGLEVDRRKIDFYLRRSLMSVTVLNSRLGYDLAAQVAKYAREHDVDLRTAVEKLGIMDLAEFDRIVDPEKMVGSGF